MWESQAFGEPCPLTRAQLESLFEHLDQLGFAQWNGSSIESSCDHTFSGTMNFARQSGWDAQSLVDWLGMHGAGCDCEVLLNTTVHHENAIELEREGS